MSLISGVHHIATATADVDRLVDFYRQAFEIEPAPGHPADTPVGRLAFFDFGGVQIQAVQSGDIQPAPADTPAVLLQKDLRLDHFTVHATSLEAFNTIRDRLVGLDATDGDVQDFQGASLLVFTDPDGHTMEVIFDPS